MANDKVMVTVTVPEGLRAVVVMKDDAGNEIWTSEATVVGGTSQVFFVDSIRKIDVREGLPHCMTDALDRKPDSE